MLISKEVEVELSSMNIEHYENKGYFIPRRKDKKGRFTVERGTKIIVKTEDLTLGAYAHVDVKCDCDNCENPYLNMKWQSYSHSVKEDGSYYCMKCAIKLYGTKNRMKSRLKKVKSFEQWCIENNRLDVLDRWDYELNNCKPSEITYNSVGLNNKGYWFKCLKHSDHDSELKNIVSFLNGNEGSIICRKCNSFAQYLIDNYGENALELYWSNKNTINPWEINYGSRKPKVWIKCQNKDKPYHQEYDMCCNGFVNGNRCPYCNNKKGKVHPKDSLGQYIIDNFEKEFLDKIWSDKNDKSPFEYSPKSHKKLWWKCPNGKHDDFLRSIASSNDCDFRCNNCTNERKESILQEKVRLYLNELGYVILHEHNCGLTAINPKTKLQLPYDNEIEELKLIIEVHGEQHYKVCLFNKLQAKKNNTTAEHQLHMLKVRDRYKRIYAKLNGYKYLEIPYSADNKKQTWKKLIDDKINKIINKELKEVV